MGYLNKSDLRGDSYYDNVCSCFQKVDGSSVNLADFVVIGYDDDYSEGAIQIAEIGGTGITDSITVGKQKLRKVYTWLHDGEDMPAGWYDDDEGGAMVDQATYDAGPYEANEIPLSKFGDAKLITFGPAKGFRVIQADGYPNGKLVFNGEVRKTLTEVEDFRGEGYYDIVGNNTPAPISLADMYVTGYDDDYSEGAIQIAEIGGTGVTDSITVGGKKLRKVYTWLHDGEDMPAGWYDDDDGGAMVDQATYDAGPYAANEIPLSKFGDAKLITFTPGSAFRAIQADGYPNAKLNIPQPKGL